VVAVILSAVAFNQRGIAQQNAATATIAQGEALLLADSRATQQAIAEGEAAARATQQAIAEDQAQARATAQAIAEAAEEDALRQAAIGLASQAELQMIGPNPERAILLALEAVENYPYTWQAERSLAQAVLKHKLIFDLPHGGELNSAYLSPDETRILTSGENGLVKVWDAITGDELLNFLAYAGDDALFCRAVWSPSGDRILTWAIAGPRVWDAATGEQLLDLSDHGHYAAGWSPDGTRIITWLSPQEDTALVWDAATGELLFTLPEPQIVWSAHWSPDGTKIITNNGNIWDAENGVQLGAISDKLQTSPSDPGWPWSLDGELIASAGIDDPLRIWDAETGEELVASSGGAGGRNARWSPKGDRIFTFDAEGEQQARVWDIETGVELYQFPGVKWGSWSPDGQYIFTGDDEGKATVWDAASGAKRLSFIAHSGTVNIREWLLPSDRAITFSVDGSAKVWNLSQALLPLGCQPSCPDSPVGGWFSGVAWSPDGQKVARGFVDGTVTVWEVATGEELLTVQYEPVAEHMLASGVIDLSWSPDGKRLLGGCGDGVARVWDAVSGEESLRLPAHEVAAPVSSFWSPDGMRIVTVSEYGAARVWDAITGEELLTFGEHTPYSVSWSPDGSRIVTSDGTSTGGGAKVWDAITGEVLLDLFPATFGFGVGAVAFSPDGMRIVAFSEDKLGRVFDARSGEELLTFPGKANAWEAKWSPSGDRILIGGLGGAVKVLDVNTGNDLINYEIEAGAGASWSPDGKQIAISDWDGNLSIHPAWQSLEELIEYAHECCVFRQLTPEERDQFGLPAKP
jgi:WD40 repeat protein